MHEASLAVGMLEKITEIAKKENAKKVLKVRVKIGKLSGVVVDSFKFAFDATKKEFLFTENAVLEIEEVPAVYRCFDCGKKFETETAYFPECPECKSLNVTILSGEELQVVDLEIDV